MVVGQLTRAEAESALRRLEGLRDDWQRQIVRWRAHYEQADAIKSAQREPSAPLTYTVEVCLNQVGVATIRYNELERLIADYRPCALYLVHLPIADGPDASFRSSLPDLASIPHAAPGTAAVAMPGQIAGMSAQMAPMGMVQGLSNQIQMYDQYGAGGGAGGMGPQQTGMYGGGAGGGGFQQQQQPQFQSQQSFQMQQPSFQSQSSFQQQQPPPFQPQSSFGQQSFTQTPYSSQPLNPQHTQALYAQQTGYHNQNADQARVNQFSQNVFNRPASAAPAYGQQGGGGGGQDQGRVSALNPFAANAPHMAVLDASQRFPAVQ